MKKFDYLKFESFGTSGGQLSHNLKTGSLNGIILVVGGSILDGDKVSITFQPKQGEPKTLVRSVPLKALQLYSNLKFGAVRTRVEKLLDDAGGVETDALSIQGIYIDLGHITLDGFGTLEVKVDAVANVSRTGSYRLYSVYRQSLPSIMKSYYMNDQTNHSADFVRELFLYNAGGLDNGGGTAPAMDISLTTDEGQHNFDLTGAIAQTMMFSSVEGLVPDGLIHIHSDTVGLPSTVAWSYDGTPANTFTLVVADAVIPDLLSEATTEHLSKVLSKTDKMEFKYPELARAYRHAGVSDKSENIRATIKHFRSK
jgi:hypothetical protein